MGLATLALLLTPQRRILTAEPGQQVLFVAPADFYEWTAPRDTTFAWIAIDLHRNGIIGDKDFFDMTAAFRKKKK